MLTVSRRIKTFSLEVGTATTTSTNSRMGKLLDAVSDTAVEKIRDEANPPLKDETQKVEDKEDSKTNSMDA